MLYDLFFSAVVLEPVHSDKLLFLFSLPFDNSYIRMSLCARCFTVAFLLFAVCEASELVALARRHLHHLKQFFINVSIRETLSRPAQDASVIIGQVFLKEVEAKICLKACEEWLVDSGGIKRSPSVQSAFENVHFPDARKPYPEAEMSVGDPGILDVALALNPAQHPGSKCQWFELISTLLQSSEYEVRLAVLEFIVNHLSLGKDWYKLSCDEQVEIDSAVFKGSAAKLQNQLFSMAMETERHADCIVKVTMLFTVLI